MRAYFTDALERIESLERQVAAGKDDREHLYWKAKGLEAALREAKYQLNQGQNSSYVIAHIDKALNPRPGY